MNSLERYQYTTRNKQKIFQITPQTLDAAYQDVCADSTYATEADLLKDALLRFPENTDPTIIAMKAALVDVTNSTHMSQHKAKLNLYDIVQGILSIKDFDAIVKNPSLTQSRDLISELVKACSTVDLFSFFSKYCYYHNYFIYQRDDFSKYDTIVSKCLPEYFSIYKIKTAKQKKITRYYLDQLRKHAKYNEFNDLIESLAKICGVNAIKNYRTKIDALIWYPNK